ncbi:MAG: pyridoxal phosphate-dependent aminotransferase [Bacilli bacterium]|nr:pyridoxal phosphate-dependent aminotransferase [Bacilli bacterium]
MANKEFDEIVNRRHSGSIKWNVKDGELPMWVADMDFKTAPAVVEALRKRVEHGVFGYCAPDQEWADAYVSFYGDRYGWNINPKDLVFCLGVVPVLSSSVRALTSVGDNVVLFTPVYNIFFNSIVNNKRVPLPVPLLEENGAFHLNYPAIEKAFADEKTTLCFFCNPHNPVGKIFAKEEMGRLADLARKHGVRILSDEIHGPVSRPGHPYVPFLSLDGVEDVVYSAISPTKAFNLAGIHTAAIVMPNEEIRKKVERQINTDEVAEPNVFSCVASTAAFNEGREWLDNLNEYVFANRDYAETYIQENIPELIPIHGDATYLLWVDCRKICADSRPFLEFLREKTGLFVSAGEIYGPGGEGFVRINLAAPRSLVEDGLRRLKEGVVSFRNKR